MVPGSILIMYKHFKNLMVSKNFNENVKNKTNVWGTRVTCNIAFSDLQIIQQC